jgi:hypothetical protein
MTNRRTTGNRKNVTDGGAGAVRPKRIRGRAGKQLRWPSFLELESRTLLSNLPDLVLSSASGPSSIVAGSGQQIPLNWTVTNTGASIPGGALWDDAVYLAPSATFNASVDVRLDVSQHSVELGLNGGSSYATTDEATVPNVPSSLIGNEFLLFVANSDNGLDVSSAAGAVKAVPVAITAPKVDLAISNATSTATTGIAGDGNSLTFSWTVTNKGTDTASAQRSDEVILANASTLAAATKTWTLGTVGGVNRFNAGSNLPPLGPGIATSESLQAALPNVPAGNYFLIYAVNAGNDQSETDAPARANDTTSLPLKITRPNVDLSLATASLSTTGPLTEGSSVTVGYTVHNGGTDAAGAGWRDSVYLSSTPSIGTGSNAVLLTSVTPPAYDFPLAAKSSYTNYATFTIPQAATGKQYLVVVANDGGAQAETDDANDSNNAFAIPVTLQAPTLSVALAGSIPTSAVEGATIPVTYTVTNSSSIATAADWQDAIYLSSSSTFNPSTATFIASFATNNSITDLQPLAPGASYTRTVELDVPSFATGNRFVFVVADYGAVNASFASGSSSVGFTGGQPLANVAKNVVSFPLSLSAPDLKLVTGTAPSSATLGSTINVSYQVQNIGSVAAGGSWTDSVYLSPTSTLDDSAIFLQSFDESANSPLAANASYTNSQAVSLPQSATGNEFLIFTTNVAQNAFGFGNSTIQGETSFANNTFALPIAIAAPNLQIASPTAPSTAVSNSQINVSWQVKNTGTVAAPGPWNDSVYIGSSPSFDPNIDTLITSFDEASNAPLAAGASYTESRSITLPAVPAGHEFLFIVADDGQDQGETSATSSVATVPITISAPDLKLVTATAPSSAIVNSQVNVSWQVQNAGSVAALGSWYDAVYLSNTPTLNVQTATFITSFSESASSQLQAGKSYTDHESLTIPSAATGSQYLIFVTDVLQYSNSFEGLIYPQGETDYTNNTFAVPITFKAPDLRLTTATAPSAATEGSTFNVSWQVQNAGTVAALGSWYDGVYLSTTPTFNPSTAVQITSVSQAANSSLQPGKGYTASASITLPQFAVGNEYLIFATDVYPFASFGSSIAPPQGDVNLGNNFFALPITLSAPDLKLVTASTSASTSVVENSSINVSWQVQNNGNVAAPGSWYDAVYIGDSPNFDPSDTLIATFNQSANSGLQPGKSYTNTNVAITIPATSTVGAKYLIFVNDVSSNLSFGQTTQPQGETDRTNDTFAVPITVTAPDLKIANATAPASAVEGSTVNVSWQVQNNGTVPALGTWSDAVYLSSTPTLNPFGINSSRLIDTFIESANSPLQPGKSYTDSQSISIPSWALGSQYLIIETNVPQGYGSSSAHPQGETNYANDTFVVPITLTAPDLKIVSATAPATAVENGTISVSWKVQNVGAVAAPATWSDAVYLSPTPTYNPGTAVFVDEFDESGNTPLAAGSSYTDTESITIPSTAVGSQYLLVVADSGEEQPETDTTNDTFPLSITLTAPDLKLVTASATPTSAVEGAPVKVTWQVQNLSSTIAALGNWSDAVYISPTSDFNPLTATLVGSFYEGNNSPLQPGASYTESQTVNIPAAPTGNQFLIVVTNYPTGYSSVGPTFHSQGETDFTNDAFSIPVSLSAPDLNLATATAPSSVVEGEKYPVSWQVKNLSTTVAAPGQWYDAVYMGSSPIFNPSADTLVSTFPESGNSPLAAGASYTENESITIPNTTVGSQYLIFVTNVTQYEYSSAITHPQGETDYTNDTFAVPITVAAPTLQVVSATAPSSAIEGSSINVSWQVQNTGAVPAVSGWTDSVYLASSPIFNPATATLVTSFSETSHAPLQPGASYAIKNQAITIPSFATGAAYLIIVTNSTNSQGVASTNGNSFAVPITLTAPDLTLVSATAPSTAIEGGSISVSWKVQNASTTVQAPGTWFDAVYLSSSPTYNPSSARFINSFSESSNSPLLPQKTYTANQSITIPAFATGSQYLIFLTNVSQYGGTTRPQGETDFSNDSFAVPITLSAPDLQLTKITSPASNGTVTVDGSASISWQVTNGGTVAAPGTWTDLVYISSTPNLDSSAQLVASYDASGNTGLGAGKTYTGSVNVTVPNYITPGNRYLIVETNGYNAQPEADFAHNRVGANNLLAIPITVAAPDFVVTAATVDPATAEVGNNATVTLKYTVKNQGTGAALGRWEDSVYVGTSKTFDPTQDTLITSFDTSGFTGLAVNGTYSQQEQITIPNTATGARYLFVVADDALQFSNQAETNTSNNTFAVPISLTQPSVDLKVSTSDNVTTAVSNQSVDLSLTVTNIGSEDAQANWVDEIIFSRSATPTSSDQVLLYNNSEFTGSLPLGKNQSYTATTTTNLPAVAPGNYFLVYVANQDNAQGETSTANNSIAIPITITAPDLTVTAASIATNPATLLPSNSYTANFTVKNIGAVPAYGTWSDIVYLSPTPTYNASTATYLTSNYEYSVSPLAANASYNASATFSIPASAAAGKEYLLVYTNPGTFQPQGESNYANNLFAIPVQISAPAANLAVTKASGPATASLGQQIPLSWTVANQGQTAASGTWSDAVFLSSDKTVDDTAVFLGSFDETSHSGLPTTAGSNSYNATGTVTIPGTSITTGYIIIVTNYFNTQAVSSTANATFAIPITISAPNLVVTKVSVPATVTPGQTVSVTWTVKNEGNAATIDNWTDEVYLSANQTFEYGDEFLASATITNPTNPLAVGASYTTTQNITIPASASGPAFVLVMPDFDGGQPEVNGFNTFAQAITVSPEPDLTVNSVAISANPAFGQQATVTWVDDNVGEGSTATAWTDAVYLSATPSLTSSSVLLNTLDSSSVGVLNAGASANRSLNVNLPLSATLPGGTYYIVVVANQTQALPETSYSNNTSSASATITVVAPNLVPSGIGGFPTVAQTLQAVPISWVDTNQGNADATKGWADSVYASPDGKLADATLLGTFPVDGPLAAGKTLDQAQLVTLPTTPGTYFILVVADANGGVNVGPNVVNATGASSTTINVVQEPLPDLVVSSIAPPPNGVFAGQTVPITYTVKNQGSGDTTVPVWHDFIVLSQDPTLTYSGALNPTGAGADQLLNNQPVLDEVDNLTFLAPGQSYTQTINVSLPQSASGKWYAYVFPNGLGFHYPPLMTESTRANNLAISTAFNVQPAPSPDLAASQVTVPAQTFSGQPMPISWNVVNQGQGATNATSWTDNIYMSSKSTLDSSATLLGSVTHTGALAPGDHYAGSTTVNLPVGVSGSFFFFVQTNANGAVAENGKTSNNIASQSTATTVNLTPPPQLQVGGVSTNTVPALASHLLTVQYTVANIGATTTPNSSWTDAFYLSPTPTLNPATQIALGTVTHTGSLAAGDSYSGRPAFVVPNGVSGAEYLVVQTDSGKEVFQVDRSTDIGASKSTIAIQSRPADLTVAKLSTTAASPIGAGATIPVTWTVKNQGTGDSAISAWTDALWVTTGTAFTNPIYLGSFVHTGLVAANGSYTVTKQVHIPIALASGNYDLWVETNAPDLSNVTVGTIFPPSGSGPVYESSSANNFSAPLAFSLTQKLAALQVSGVTASPTSVQNGGAITVKWSETNAGTGATNANFWYDDIWLSTKSTLQSGGTDTFLGSVSHAGVVAAGGSYKGAGTFSLPATFAPGSYFVIVATDRPVQPPGDNGTFDNQVYEGSAAIRTAASSAITVTQAPAPDLTVQTVTTGSSTVVSGQPLSVSWTVKNLDAATTQTWFDAVYLSLDTTLDTQTNVLLGYVEHDGGLATGKSYTGSSTFMIPQGVAGTYYALVDTNSSSYGGAVNENGRTSNNSGASAAPETISLPKPTNLVAGTVTAPSTGVAGQTVTVSYTVTNNSSTDAQGQWDDALYLSPTSTWSSTDPVLAIFTHTGGLAAGKSYTATVPVTLPGVLPGSYNIIVRTNIRDAIPETSLSDNQSASQKQVAITVPALTLGTASTASLGQGQSAYYRVTVSAGQALRFSLQTDSANAATASNELYVSFGAMPTSFQADFRYGKLLAANQSITIPATQAGTYYVYVRAASVTNATESVSLTASIIPFSVTAVSPTTAGNIGTTTLQINGALFDRATKFSLVGPANVTIPAFASEIQDGSTAFATFNLTGAAIGSYSVVATPASGTAATLSGSVTVQSGTGGNVVTGLTGPPNILVGRDGTVNVNYANNGNADTGAPLIYVLSPTGNKIGLSSSFLANEMVAFLGTSPSGPAGILSPGTPAVRSIYFKSTSDASTNNGFQLITVSTSDSDPIDWNQVNAWIFPSRTAAPNWNAAYALLQQWIGSTWGGFVSVLDQGANLVVPGSLDPSNPLEALDAVVQKAIAAVNSSLSGTLSAQSLSVAIAGRTVVASNSTTGDSFTAKSFNDGSFVFPTLPAGTYTLSVPGAIVTSNAMVAIGTNQAVAGKALTLAPGATLSGAVTDRASGLPITGASVRLVSEADGSVTQLFTDSSGNYSVTGLGANLYDLIVDTPGYARNVVTGISLASGGATASVALTPESVISGTVSFGPGGPKGSVIQISAQLDGNTDPNQVYSTNTTASTFSLNGLPAGSYDVTIMADGYITQVLANQAVAATRTLNLGTINLIAAATITGTVTSKDPSQTPGGQLVAAMQNGTQAGLAVTSSTGAYSIGGLSAGSYTVEIVGPDQFSTTSTATVSAGQTLNGINLAIQPGGAIGGTVTSGANAQPVAGINVFASQSGGTVVQTTTSANGAYQFSGLAPGTYQVYLQIGGAKASQSVPVTKVDGTVVTANLQVAIAAHINGKLTTNAGAPITDGQVTLYFSGQPVATANTDATGAYSFLLARPGKFDLVAISPSASFNPITNLPVAAGATVVQNFKAGTGTVSVKFTDAAQAVAGGNVFVDRLNIEGGSAEAGSQTIGTNGTATFANLVPGQYQVVAALSNGDTGQATITVVAGKTVNATVTLSSMSSASGTITDNTGAPLGNAAVSFQSTTNSSVVYTTSTASDGTYSLSGIAAGTYNVIALANGFQANIQTGVSVSGAATVNARLTPSTTTISGKLTDGSGNPVPGAVVLVANGSGQTLGFADVQTDGTFQITTAIGTSLTLQIYAQGYTAPQVPAFNAAAGATVPLGSIALQPVAVDPGASSPNVNTVHTDAAAGNQAWAQDLYNEAKQIYDYASSIVSSVPPPQCPDCEGEYDDALAAQADMQQSAGQVANQAIGVTIQAVNVYTTAAAEVAGIIGKVELVAAAAFTISRLAPAFWTAVGPWAKTAFDFASLVDNLNEIINVTKELPETAKEIIEASDEGDIEKAGALAAKEVAEIGGAVVSALTFNSKFVSKFIVLENAHETAEVNEFLKEVLEYKFNVIEAALKGLKAGADALTKDPFERTIAAAKLLKAEKNELDDELDDLHDKIDEFNDALEALADCEDSNCDQPPDDKKPPKQPIFPIPPFFIPPDFFKDPNALVGPRGFGDQNFVAANSTLNYEIDFENEPNATAPVQQVVVTQQLDANLDWRTFRLGNFGFSGNTYTVAPNSPYLQQTIDLKDKDGFLVQVTATVNVQTGLATWTFTTLDPATGQIPLDTNVGFLPPDSANGIGEGFVTYTIQPKSGVTTGTVINGQAIVDFVGQPPINTNSVSNTISAGGPVVTVTPPAALITNTNTFNFSWTGTSLTNGPAVAGYNVYVAVDGGPFNPYLQNTTLTQTTFTGTVYHTYSFYVVAVDNAGVSSAPSTTFKVALMPKPTQPAAPTLLPADDSGKLGDSVTDIARPRITGTAVPNATIQIFNGKNVSLGKTTADTNGNYTFPLPNTLAPGTYKYYVVASNVSGASPASPMLTLTVVAVPPVVPTPSLVPASDSGKKGDRITDVAKPQLQGTAPANTTVQLLNASGTVIATTVANAKGSYVVAVPRPLAPGTYSYNVRSIDKYGDTGPLSKPLSVTIVAPPTAPAAPRLLASDSNGAPGGLTTTLAKPHLTGTAPAGTTIQVLNKLNRVINSVVVPPSGTYVVQIPGPLGVGSFPYRVQDVDKYGNISPPSAPVTIKVVAAVKPHVLTASRSPNASHELVARTPADPAWLDSLQTNPTGTTAVTIPVTSSASQGALNSSAVDLLLQAGRRLSRWLWS